MTAHGPRTLRAGVFPFGTLPDGTAVNAARLEDGLGFSLTVLEYGATLQSLRVPVPGRAPVDVVLGYDDAAGYAAGHDYLGATVGRFCNRIGGARFSLNGREYRLAQNDGENHLHGGLRGFDKRMWSLRVCDGAIVCERLSPDGEEGYPGDLRVRVTFSFPAPLTLCVAFDAESSADTLVNLTSHSYFNLNGGGSVLGHRLQIFADRFCENDEAGLPTGSLLEVAGTPFDFRAGKTIGAEIDAPHEQLRRCGGYDHNFCLAGKRAAVLRGEQSGLEMTVETDLPGMQLYTANFLTRCRGKGGAEMAPRGAVCLETQLYPNAMRCYGFPSPVLRAGQPLHRETTCRFTAAR